MDPVASPAAQVSSRLQAHDSAVDPFYSFMLPCPGEGLGGTWEYCAERNLCIDCQLCKVCGHCLPSCPEYVDLGLNSPRLSSMAPSVSIKFIHSFKIKNISLFTNPIGEEA